MCSFVCVCVCVFVCLCVCVFVCLFGCLFATRTHHTGELEVKHIITNGFTPDGEEVFKIWFKGEKKKDAKWFGTDVFVHDTSVLEAFKRSRSYLTVVVKSPNRRKRKIPDS